MWLIILQATNSVAASPPVSSIDWNIAAAAFATFFGTLAVTIWGWFQGRKKVAEQVAPVLNNPNTTPLIVQDNKSVIESTLIMKELRDQLLLNHQAMVDMTRAIRDNTSSDDDVLTEIRRVRGQMEKNAQAARDWVRDRERGMA